MSPRSLQSFSVRHGIPQQHPLDADLRLKYSIPNTFESTQRQLQSQSHSWVDNAASLTVFLVKPLYSTLLYSNSSSSSSTSSSSSKKKLSKRSRDQLDVSNVEAAQLAAALLMSNETAEREHRLRHSSVRPRKNRPRPRTEDHDDCLSVTKRPRNEGCADSFTF